MFGDINYIFNCSLRGDKLSLIVKYPNLGYYTKGKLLPASITALPLSYSKLHVIWDDDSYTSVHLPLPNSIYKSKGSSSKFSGFE